MASLVAGWPSELVKYAERLGASRARLLQAAGLTEAELADPDNRVSLAQNAALWREVERVLSDPNLGINFANSLHSAHPFGVVGYLARAEATWGDVLRQIEKYHRLLGLASARVVRQPGIATLSLELGPPSDGVRHMGEAVMATVILMCRRVTGHSVNPLEVRLAHPRPAVWESHARGFGCPVLFGATTYAVDWNEAHLSLPLASHDPGVHRYLSRIADRQLAAEAERGLVTMVSEIVSKSLAEGVPTLVEVGRRLGHSSRSLQRKLKEQGSTFGAVVDGVRRKLALELVESNRLSLSEIALRLGFADASAFRRAFRRWKGTSPREERRRHRTK